jgi:cobalt-zinc-cadmium efflux system membrane fusion protein
MRLRSTIKPLSALALVAGLALAAYFTRGAWLPYVLRTPPAETALGGEEVGPPPVKIIVSEQAQQNLGITAKSAAPQTFWKTIRVPGMVVDRPGQSDRGIVAPVTGVVTKVGFFPGDTVRPGDTLFTLRLMSESLHTTQTELFKATQDIKLAQAQRQRLAASGGAVPESKVIEVDNQIRRLDVAVQAYREDLRNRGLRPEQIAAAADGKFVTEITIPVPARSPAPSPTPSLAGSISDPAAPTFELQELKAELGQQVQAGQTLCLLANHQLLSVEGRAFRDETPLLERSVRERWPVEIDFQEAGSDWPALDQPVRIRHLANTIDPVNRTFAFRIPLENQSRAIEDDGRTQMLWRFRPGQKVKLLVRVERLDNVFVFPKDAVARDGAEAFVFTQNVNTFERRPVRVLTEDRDRVVVANDGAIVPGSFVAQAAATQLGRMTKSQSDSVPKGFHVHADGSLHKNEDEGKE